MKTINQIEYLAHVWKPAGEDGAYPLNPKRGNEIEKGISDAADRINLIIPELTVIDEEPSLLMTGNYPGRKIDDIPEIQAELDAAGSVAAFLNAREGAQHEVPSDRRLYRHRAIRLRHAPPRAFRVRSLLQRWRHS